jgi:magnesium chelatase family protein
VPQISEQYKYKYDFSEIKGQQLAKRAIEIAAAGGHNVLMSGPPGAGKSMLDKRMVTIMPPLNPQQMLEASIIASVSGHIKNGEIITKRQFRAPHHSCSMPAMVGGGIGNRIKPGEVSLAHYGILFLDELPEFSRHVLDALRQPIENNEVLISRAQSNITFPANLQLVAAMNPCPCGYLGDNDRSCRKAPICADNYISKISGPLLDRIDIHLQVKALSLAELRDSQKQHIETSAEIRTRVMIAYEIQRARYKECGINNNSELDNELLLEYTQMNENTQNMLDQAMEKLKLSMRSYNRILKVARTIADLDASESKIISSANIAEAISYRRI